MREFCKNLEKPPIETVEIDGQTLMLDREPCKFDWENANIDQEVELLDRYYKDLKHTEELG